MKTQILLDHEKSIDGAAYIVRALLRIHGDPPADTARVPLGVALVLDRSGSMSGAPLARAKEAAALLVRRLAPEDVVSVVAYDHEVHTIAEPATGEAQADLVHRIGAITSGGMTNLSGGWLRGRDLVALDAREVASRRIILLTDGLANVGITDPEILVGLCAKAREQGIRTTTIGFGRDYDEVLLRRMADAGGGSMYYIERPDQAPAVFAEEIGGLLSLSAQNLSVEVRPAAAAELAVVHHAYPRQTLDDGVRLEIGDLYAREPRHLLVEFLVTADDSEAEVEIAELTVTAHVVKTGGSIERQEIRLPIRASLAAGPRVDPEVRRELLLPEAARAREEAYRAHRRGDDAAAGAVLREAALELRDFDRDDAALAEEVADLEAMARLFEDGAACEADTKYLFQRSYATTRSRRGTAPLRRSSGERRAADRRPDDQLRGAEPPNRSSGER
jgi:Ca-activated chloride channel family protein